MPGKILVADPIVTNRIAMKMLLTKEYFELCTLGCVDDISETIEKHRPDVILLSHRFSQTTGYDICQKIKNDPRHNDIPIIITTNSARPNWVLAEKSGADDLICPQYDQTYLIQRIRTLYRHKAELDASMVHLRATELVGFGENAPVAFKHIPSHINLCLLDDGGAFCERIKGALGDTRAKSISVLNENIDIIAQTQNADVIIVPFINSLFRSDQSIVWKINMLIKDTNKPVLMVFENANAQSHAMALRLGLSEYFCASENFERLGMRVRSMYHFSKRRKSARDVLSEHIQQAKQDSLTGLYNRRYGLKYLSHLMQNPTYRTKPLAIMMLDLDNFKQLNDQYGHPACDDILQQLGGLLKSGIRNADMIARVGGEEFLIILPDCFLATARMIASRILAKIRHAQFLPDNTNTPSLVTASIGIAIFDGKESCKALITRADDALFQSKTKGRDQFNFQEA